MSDIDLAPGISTREFGRPFQTRMPDRIGRVFLIGGGQNYRPVGGTAAVKVDFEGPEFRQVHLGMVELDTEPALYLTDDELARGFVQAALDRIDGLSIQE